MLNLSNPQTLQVSPTGSDVDVFASYVDWLAGVATPDNNGGVTIVDGAGATDIVATPALGTIRNVKGVIIQNKTSTPVTIDVTIDDGVNTYTLLSAFVVTIPGGSHMVLEDDGIWRVYYADVGISVAYIPWSNSSVIAAYSVYVVPTGVRQFRAECIGGGGGGGGCLTAATNSAAAGGGGAGGYGQYYFTPGPIDEVHFSNGTVTYEYYVGAGGAGGVAGATTGTAGGGTFFGFWDNGGGPNPIIQTAGGSGGVGDTVATIHVGGKGGDGGSGTNETGYTLTRGQCGGTGRALAAAQCVSGSGGDCICGPQRNFGRGGQGNKNTTAGGTNALGYGAGGGGASIISGGLSQPGGNGAPGLIIITEYRYP